MQEIGFIYVAKTGDFRYFVSHNDYSRDDDTKSLQHQENSGHYIKQFKVKDDDSRTTYQYSFIAKDKPIVFIPYTSTAFEVKVKYPTPQVEES
ncbi:hypothetical protein HB943_10830 [Listeria weihenstephanensis]|uniref:Uncharacterized protein n=1 Tax=Listeria weihenstephanensis TaxID=1006155 RepID=A0A841Z9I8_9LIST|nr:hypothetical protein [Listeria weihenstephanensis]MBC1501096.1 hypothetical protein [Listeria weihenstephanensis]